MAARTATTLALFSLLISSVAFSEKDPEAVRPNYAPEWDGRDPGPSNPTDPTPGSSEQPTFNNFGEIDKLLDLIKVPGEPVEPDTRPVQQQIEEARTCAEIQTSANAATNAYNAAIAAAKTAYDNAMKNANAKAAELGCQLASPVQPMYCRPRRGIFGRIGR